MKVLVLGGSGMLGHKIFQTLSPSFECWATFRTKGGNWRSYPRYFESSRLLTGVDALRFDSVIHAFSMARPDAVVNCIGVVKQKKEAKDAHLSLEVNALLPHRLAELCSACGARLVLVSTDCVFSGKSGGAYTEGDPTDAEDIYGKSKCLGEVDRPDCLTLRTSIVGWDLSHSDGLLEWFVGQRGGAVQGYRNAVFSGLSTAALARVVSRVLKEHPRLAGLYHVSSEPISKFDLLSRLNQSLGLGIVIQPVDEPRIDRSLDSSRFRNATGLRIPSWSEMLAELTIERGLYDQWSNSLASS